MTTALITGAARGIGLSIARQIGRRAQVALVDLDGDELNRAARAVPGSLPIQADVRDVNDLARAARDIGTSMGTLDLLVVNAGVPARLMGDRLWELADDEWRWVFDVNVFGVVNTLRAFVPMLSNKRAHVLFTASMASFLTGVSVPTYTASKHALVAIAETLRHQLERDQRDVTVTILAPGRVATELGRWRMDQDQRPTSQTLGPAHETLRPDAVATLALDAVANGRPYVFPHPEMIETAAIRFAEIVDAGRADQERQRTTRASSEAANEKEEHT